MQARQHPKSPIHNLFSILQRRRTPIIFHRSKMIQTRPATVEDMAAIADIYNHYILNTTITFETEAVSESNRREWF